MTCQTTYTLARDSNIQSQNDKSLEVTEYLELHDFDIFVLLSISFFVTICHFKLCLSLTASQLIS